MISMIEKIDRFNLEDCRDIKQELTEILKENKEEFWAMEDIQEFEVEWMGRYIKYKET